jgi:hypothetical protein
VPGWAGSAAGHLTGVPRDTLCRGECRTAIRRDPTCGCRVCRSGSPAPLPCGALVLGMTFHATDRPSDALTSGVTNCFSC